MVEIKNGDPGELVKGIYQAVKYRALMQDEKGHGNPALVDAILVAYSIHQRLPYLQEISVCAAILSEQ